MSLSSVFFFGPPFVVGAGTLGVVVFTILFSSSLVISLVVGSIGFLGVVAYAMHFLEKRPWLRFVVRNPKVIWYWLLSWRKRRINKARTRANEKPARQEEILADFQHLVYFGAGVGGANSKPKLTVDVSRVEYYECGSSKTCLVYNPDKDEEYTLSFPHRTSYAAVHYRYNGLKYVLLVCPSAHNQNVKAHVVKMLTSVLGEGDGALNFLYDISSGDPGLNEWVEKVFGPFGTYRGTPAAMFDFLARKVSRWGSSAMEEMPTVIVRGLRRNYLLDMRTRAIQPFQGDMDDERALSEPPFVFYGGAMEAMPSSPPSTPTPLPVIEDDERVEDTEEEEEEEEDNGGVRELVMEVEIDWENAIEETDNAIMFPAVEEIDYGLFQNSQ